MKYILDTDTLIYLLKGQQKLVATFEKTPSEDISITIINHAELLFGAFNSLKKQENLKKIQAFLKDIPILPFCQEASSVFAENKACLKQKGEIIADLDLMIASIAIKNRSVLVTNNTKHFARIKKIKLDNWCL